MHRTVPIFALLLSAIFSLAILAPTHAFAQSCVPNVCGDVDGSGSVSATDALSVLVTAVGGNATLSCSCQSGELACPNVAGTYSGTQSSTLSECSDPSENGSEMTPFGPAIVTQSECTITLQIISDFQGERDFILVIGEVAEDGSITAPFEEYEVASDGGFYVSGTITGQFSGDAFTGSVDASDIIGETCQIDATFDLTRD